MFRFDLHVHSWRSADAADSPEDLVKAARARGLHGIAITDHDSCAAHPYCRSVGLQTPDGLPVDGFLVVPGVEVSTADGHLLCIGVELPDLSGRPAADVCREIRARGGIAMPAHPFDHWRRGIGLPKLDGLEMDAIEVFNSAVSSRSFNEKAADYASKRSLPGTANSDAHHASAVGTSFTEFDLPELSVGALLAGLRAGGTPRGQYLSKTEALKKHFANFFRKGKAPAA